MTFGASAWTLPTAEDKVATEMLDRFVSIGGNFIDTADCYGPFHSERFLGNWIHKYKREDFILATKVRLQTGKGPNDVGLSRKHIMANVELSLENLQTNYIDLYQVHAWDSETPLEQTLRALNDLVRCGKVRYIGCSNFLGYQLQKALDMSKYMGLEAFVCMQPQYHLLSRQTEFEIMQVCKTENLAVIPWSPLAGGWLSGKYKRGDAAPEDGSRIAWAEKVGWSQTSWAGKATNEYTWRVLDALYEVASEIKATPAQVALRWLQQRPAVTAPIIGARKMEQFEDNIRCVTINLSEEHMKKLNDASDPFAFYPYDPSYANRKNR